MQVIYTSLQVPSNQQRERVRRSPHCCTQAPGKVSSKILELALSFRSKACLPGNGCLCYIYWPMSDTKVYRVSYQQYHVSLQFLSSFPRLLVLDMHRYIYYNDVGVSKAPHCIHCIRRNVCLSSTTGRDHLKMELLPRYWTYPGAWSHLIDMRRCNLNTLTCCTQNNKDFQSTLSTSAMEV